MRFSLNIMCLGTLKLIVIKKNPQQVVDLRLKPTKCKVEILTSNKEDYY